MDAGQHIELKRLNLIYADNGRGKTTLAAVLRSLADGNSIPIDERKRLSSSHSPHVVIELDNNLSSLVFENGVWSDTLPSLVVFDDTFVERNVHSGLSVSSQQRQNLHDLVLGPLAVTLSRQLDEHVAKIESHNQELRAKANSISALAREGLSVDEFCALPVHPDIDSAIQASELQLAAAQEQDSIEGTQSFDPISLPVIDIDEIEQILQIDLPSLEATTLEHLQNHFQRLGQGAERWVSDGMRRITESGNNPPTSICPFCGQLLEGSSLIRHYQAYFSESYAELKRTISNALGKLNDWHDDNARTEFEGKARAIDERQRFWTRFCQFDKFTLETSAIFRDWRAAWNVVVDLLTAKQAAPLEKLHVSKDTRGACNGIQ